MKPRKMLILPILIAVLFLFPHIADSVGQELRIITGTINEEEQIITDDGHVYDIVDNKKGDELAIYAGKRIEVKGKIIEQGNSMQIMVLQFTIIKKPVTREVKTKPWED